MHRHPRRRLAVLAVVSLDLLASGAAMAQSVQVFDEAPTLAQLRSIMIPPSPGGASRRIVLPHAGTLPTSPVQPAAMHVAAPLPAPAAPASVQPPQPPAQQEAAMPGVVGLRINFGFGSDTIVPSSRNFVVRVGELMKSEPQLKLRIEGHTDAVGSDAYNVTLSERRALAVARTLVALGIEPERLSVAGKGKSEPLMADPYDARNRRVQFVRVD